MAFLPLMTTTMLASAIMCLMSNSWMIIWMALEMNTLSFCVIMNHTENLSSTKSKDPTMKYFIIQSTASAVLVMYLSQQKSPISGIIFFSGTLAILVKLASAPFHNWYLTVIKSTSFEKSMILMTWQKTAPIYLLTFMMKPIVIMGIILSAVIGSTAQMNKKDIMEIMALSSVFNLSWMMMALTISTKTTAEFTVIYWASVIIMMMVMKNTSMKNISKNKSNKESEWTIMMAAATLAGMPPSITFVAKWNLLTQAVQANMLFMATALLTMSTINLYIYLRMLTSMIMKTPQMKQKQEKSKNLFTWKMILANTILMPTITM